MQTCYIAVLNIEPIAPVTSIAIAPHITTRAARRNAGAPNVGRKRTRCSKAAEQDVGDKGTDHRWGHKQGRYHWSHSTEYKTDRRRHRRLKRPGLQRCGDYNVIACVGSEGVEGPSAAGQLRSRDRDRSHARSKYREVRHVQRHCRAPAHVARAPGRHVPYRLGS